MESASGLFLQPSHSGWVAVKAAVGHVSSTDTHGGSGGCGQRWYGKYAPNVILLCQLPVAAGACQANFRAAQRIGGSGGDGASSSGVAADMWSVVLLWLLPVSRAQQPQADLVCMYGGSARSSNSVMACLQMRLPVHDCGCSHVGGSSYGTVVASTAATVAAAAATVRQRARYSISRGTSISRSGRLT